MQVCRQPWFILVFSLAVSAFAHADSETLDSPLRLQLNHQAQQISGIAIVSAKPTDYRAEFTAYGKVLDISPLLTLRQNYLSTAARYNSATAKSNLSRNGMDRLRNLHRHEAVSTRQLQEQQSQWQTAKALTEEAALQRRMIIASSRQQWGDTLTDWFTRPTSPEADDIIEHRTQLLQITLPAGYLLPASVDSIRISASGKRRDALAARLLAAAPRVEPFSQGRQYFFLIEQADLPAGLQLMAWIPRQKERLKGVIIPRSALLWHLGQSFVFIKLSDERFSRRAIDHYQEVAEGYFIADTIAAGERVVSSGAQMLLSQQLRAQIPDEDDDD
ncbi:hypothetical protein Q9L42_001975 [Methylomarinum sp. Ch1-1]|uniref:Uncharacterized protein n=1 Tax=Methylomarinum roseum TaxID=3067653 RepID=A0AAU7NVE8_9GAMM|nr:hypothetical protein [Methylomarinum sp. Ch1-1]MDP4523054.1 hypothetical protein [Methylomarinum sp. Ch1-1]